MSGSEDMAIKKARANADALKAQIRADEARVQELEAAIKDRRRELRKLERFISTWEVMAGLRSQSAGVRPQNPDKREVVARALEIITEAGHPMRRRELLAALDRHGLQIAGKDPEMVLGTMLWRSDEIVRLKKFGYWPKHLEYAPAVYTPELEPLIGATDDAPPSEND